MLKVESSSPNFLIHDMFYNRCKMHLIQEEEMTYLKQQGSMELTNVKRQGWFARSKSVRLRVRLREEKVEQILRKKYFENYKEIHN